MIITTKSISLNQIVPTLLFVVVILYFSYHVISGERGLLSLIQLSNKIEQSRSELDIVHAERLKFERDVRLLRDESLDLDLLDEQARRLLSYADKEEKVYNLE